MRERQLVTDFGAFSTPKEFLVICVLPSNNAQLWEYLVLLNPILMANILQMDQFYITYSFDAPPIPLMIPSIQLVTPSDLTTLQLTASSTPLSTLVKSYISSILIALRLDARVLSTSISPRVVRDVRSFVQVMSLTGASGSNVQFVPLAIERCVGFRVRLESGVNELEGKVLKDVLEGVRAPF